MKISLILPLFLISICNGQNISETQKDKKVRQELIVTEHLNNCALQYNYTFEMDKWQACLDEGLQKDSTIAYLWQQKAMPYFKARKYEVGMEYIDKAVQYDPQKWQPYRAFIKCIFSKQYKESIADFENCINKFGNQFVMDHTFKFYIGLCYLQLNEFNKAEVLFEEYTNEMFKKNGEDWVHHNALFYYGVSKYEQFKFDDAIKQFDRALKQYPNFSEVKYYKALCLYKLKKQKVASTLFKEAKENAKSGYTMNEDNTIYETYPYQILWK